MYKLQYTKGFRKDLERLYQFILDRNENDFLLAEEALKQIDEYLKTLIDFPYNFRKFEASNPYLREIIIPFGRAGYVVLYEIESSNIVNILAARHQLEKDYH